MRRILLLLALYSIVALAACQAAPAQSSVVAIQNRVINVGLLSGSLPGDWPMFGYDPGHTGYVDPLVQSHAVQGKLLWSQKLSPVFSSPVAGLGMLYIGGADGFLYALKQETGAVVWKVNVGDSLSDATPALEGQILFIAFHTSALVALDAHTGQIYWKFDTAEKILTPPLVVGKHVLLASSTTLWVLDATSGQLIWKFHRGVSGWPTTSVPTLVGNTVIFGPGSGTQVWALNLNDGHIKWSFDAQDRITSTTVAGSETIYVATWHGMIFALNQDTGTKRWVYALNQYQHQSVIDGVGGNMALADNHLYVGDYRGAIVCIDALRGKIIWRYATGAQVLATPIVSAGLVYSGSGDGYFYALDTHSGRPAWRYRVGEVRTSASLANNHLYVGSIDGRIYAFS